MSDKNRLYFGDNLGILREYVLEASVDLIYLDPPFNSSASYNVLFKEKSGEQSAAQITAFEDTWQWGREPEAVYREIVTSGPRKLADLMQALLSFLGRNDMMAYLVMMAVRLVELHRVLKPTGSIYLHCDPTASHYLKQIMDAVFGPTHFRNEVIWKRTSAHSAAKRWNDVHDTILFYTRADGYLWNEVILPHSDEYSARYRNQDGDGQKWADDNLTGPGIRHGDSGALWRGFDPTARGVHWKVSLKTVEAIVGPGTARQMKTTDKLDLLDRHGYIHWPRGRTGKGKGFPRFKRYLSKGGRLQDVVTDIPPINSQAQERLGYPTQKPEALLERIIRASSNEADLVLDPFCGCGTAIAVAERLKRRWIGIDITYLAINLVQRRLKDSFGEQLGHYVIIGAPTDVRGAEALKEISPHQFEWWAVDLVNARPAKDHKKGADSGIDGYINFFDDKSGKAKQVIVQVKSGYIGVNHVRDLKGVLEREKASIGALITLREPTRPMLTEAASSGFYEPADLPGRYPRLQILTIAELLGGKKLEYPAHRVETFARAERKTKSTQEGLF